MQRRVRATQLPWHGVGLSSSRIALPLTPIVKVAALAMIRRIV